MSMLFLFLNELINNFFNQEKKKFVIRNAIGA